MILKRSRITDALEGKGIFEGNALYIRPLLDNLSDKPGNAAIDVRLGRWFISLQESVQSVLDFSDPQSLSDNSLGRRHYIRFGSEYILHPGRFVLGATLEWMRLPSLLVGAIVGKSSLGRHGLVIETAPVVHPEFKGCLTLELANVGEVPIALRPGMEIAQLQLSFATGKGATGGRLIGFRRPTLGTMKRDKIWLSAISRG
jgi:dCTP deaminase